ncbi:MAG: tRNA lysidine(34) synthetase TilS [Burkholderiales bacterium]
MNTLNGMFEHALADIQQRVRGFGHALPAGSGQDEISPDAPIVSVLPANRTALAIAYSGGLDSTVLLHLARAYAIDNDVTLHAFHIHHGLSPHADRWLQHCRQACAALRIAFDARHVTLSQQDKGGIEEAARIARYAALGALCMAHEAPLLLTAHHLDDQAETVLLQLLRGSGVAGMSGMEVANRAPDMLGSPLLTVARPLLSVSRAELEDYARANDIAYIEDESNRDPRYARNALRHQVMPALAACFPGFQQRFARTAQHAQAGQRLLVELAAQDMAAARVGDALDVNHIRRLGADRADNLLRYWFGSLGIRMPSTAWLNEMRTQLLEAKDDAQLCVTHADCHIRRHRGRVFITPRSAETASEVDPAVFTWRGEALFYFPAYRGTLHFDAVEIDEAGATAGSNTGIDVDWLLNRECLLHYRQGGERLKPALNRPTKSLKHHYQAMDIPAWERLRLPLVSSGGQLLFAAGLGMNCAQVGATMARIRFRWQADGS